jgi:pSer/pThr/pTyr-binding forkhead associated (FHA) protein
MAGPRDVVTVGIRLLANEPGFRESLTAPVLLWPSPPAAKPETLLLATEAGSSAPRAQPGKPVFFDVQKTETNAFAAQIAIGRTANNDIAIADNSVSRFHAWITAPDGKRRWRLTDAESSVGTWVGMKRLKPRTAHELHDQDRVRFGNVELTYLEPESFIAYLLKMAEEK